MINPVKYEVGDLIRCTETRLGRGTPAVDSVGVITELAHTTDDEAFVGAQARFYGYSKDFFMLLSEMEKIDVEGL